MCPSVSLALICISAGTLTGALGAMSGVAATDGAFTPREIPRTRMLAVVAMERVMLIIHLPN
jgi:hypothetical protein